MNILIIGYCKLDDGFLYASRALENLNYTIFFFPYFNYILDEIPNKDDILNEFIHTNNIEICLWWNNSIQSQTFEQIISKPRNLNQSQCTNQQKDKYNTPIKHYFFNWDPFLYNYEKYNADIWKERIEERKKIYPLLDHVFSCFEKEINYFKSYLLISYLPPGFDKTVSYFKDDPLFECDISIVCTNLYDYKAEFPEDATNITRSKIVNKLYENRDKIKFHIYGPEKFKDQFPDCYKGFISYKDCYKVFSNSKINLSIHPMVNELNSLNSTKEYFSERVPQILGCKGLLMTNSYFTNILKNKVDYVYIDKNKDINIDILDIVKYIIDPQNKEECDKIRENGYQKALLHYQWNSWANGIHEVIEDSRSY
jgi:hypothetical protein